MQSFPNFALADNKVYTQNYFGEIKAFVDAMERNANNYLSTLSSLRDTYRQMQHIYDQG